MADVSISYKGNEIASMNATGVKTLLTGSSFCEDDITVTYTKPAAPTPTLQTKSVTYTPTTSQQTASVTADAGYDGLNAVNVTVNAMPSGSATTPATSITANPSISVSSGGLITASVSASQSVTPTVSAGYVSSGTAGTVSVSGSNTSQLTTQAAQTITPTTTDQTIASGKYLTGTQTIKGDANLVAGNIKKNVRIFNILGTYEGSGGGGGLQAYTVNGPYNGSSIEFPNGCDDSDITNGAIAYIDGVYITIDRSVDLYVDRLFLTFLNIYSAGAFVGFIYADEYGLGTIAIIVDGINSSELICYGGGEFFGDGNGEIYTAELTSIDSFTIVK